MFAEHQPQLSALARSGPDGFKRIATFVVCTIRMPLADAAADYKLLRTGQPAVRSIFGAKHNSLAYIEEYGAAIYDELECVWQCARGEDCDDALLEIVMRIPGIGLAKGGFILQMMYGRSGCIDSHNLSRFNIPPRTFQTGRKHIDRARIPDYNRLIHKLGGTRTLWDDWCEYVAERNAVTSEYISRLHLAPLEC